MPTSTITSISNATSSIARPTRNAAQPPWLNASRLDGLVWRLRRRRAPAVPFLAADPAAPVGGGPGTGATPFTRLQQRRLKRIAELDLKRACRPVIREWFARDRPHHYLVCKFRDCLERRAERRSSAAFLRALGSWRTRCGGYSLQPCRNSGDTSARAMVKGGVLGGTLISADASHFSALPVPRPPQKRRSAVDGLMGWLVGSLSLAERGRLHAPRYPP